MKKAVLTMTAACAAVGLMVCASAPADARPNYKMAWDKVYMAEGSAMNKALEGKSNCNVCHQGKDRKNRNAYGAAIGKALGEPKVTDATKITAAIEKAAGEKADGGKTFGDLLKDGKWAPTPEEK